MNVLIDATGGASWIGGLYYKYNVMYSMLENEYIRTNISLYVLTTESSEGLFQEFKNTANIITVHKTSRRMIQVAIIYYARKYHCKYVYSAFEKWYRFFGIEPIAWIPDFQHNYYPENFTKEEIESRDGIFTEIASNRKTRVVFSSEDSRQSFIKFYSPTNDNLYIAHFVSNIAPIIGNIEEERENGILSKYGLLNQQYICVMNQFWKHKNHIVVLRAMEHLLGKDPEMNIKIVFTGNLSDYRNPDYIDDIKALLSKEMIKKHTMMLGFISREEQIALMKNCEFLIQPSLFEGWGTVLEDAKTLDKTVLLSDIPVHREQMNEKCHLFDPNDPAELEALIEEEINKPHYDDVSVGITDMKKRAKEYSQGFEKLFKDLKNG